MSRRPLDRPDTRVRLNAINVRTLPAVARVNYRDTDVRGLLLRVSPTGHRSFAITYSRRHKNQTYTLGPLDRLSLADARSEAKKLLAKITLGAHPAETRAEERRDRLTVGDLVDDAMAAKKSLVLRPTTRRQWSWVVKRLIKPALEHESARGLRRDRIRAWGRQLEQKSEANAHAAFTVLRRIYSWAVENDKLEASPFVHLVAPGGVKSSDRVLSTDELRVLLRALDALPGQYSDVVLLLLLTMVRLSAALGAAYSELEDLDGKEPRWIIPAERNKGGTRQHLVQLSPAAAALFKARQERASGDLVFPSDRGGAMPWSSDYIERLRGRMGKIPRWTIHDLRRTAATHLREHLGTDDGVVSLLLGHAPPGVPAITLVYNRAERMKDRRAALDSWASFLAGLRDAQGTRRAG